MACERGSAEDIYEQLKALLDEYKAWNSVRMIISDTIAENTGHKSGTVVRFQKQFREKGLKEAQFVGCQHDILDLIL